MQRGTVQAIAASHLETPNMPSKIAQKASPLDTPSDSCVSRACASVTRGPIYFFFRLLDRPGGTGARALRRAARRQGAASKGGGGPPASDPPGAPAADRATDKRPGPGRAG